MTLKELIGKGGELHPVRPVALGVGKGANRANNSSSLETSIAFLFAALIILQATSFAVFGIGQTGKGVSICALVLHNVLAIICAWIALKRSRDVAAVFWFLFTASLVALLIPTVVGAFDSVFARSSLSESTWRVLFCLYGAPILMMLFLPESNIERLKTEVLLDLFQVAIVVTLAFTVFFLFPLDRLIPSDALARNITLSNLENSFLLIAVFIRLFFVRMKGTRSLLLRLAVFLASCAVVTYLGNWIDLHHYKSASIWFNLAWAVPYASAGLIAITWRNSSSAPVHAPNPRFIDMLGNNVILVTVLLCIAWMLTGLEHKHVMVAVFGIGASLLAFAIRLALTQYSQQRELAQRRCAQEELLAANQTITRLLDESRLETTAISQISELSSLLQACLSRDQALQVLPEKLRDLFRGTSGAIWLLNASKDRLETATHWGSGVPLHETFGPDECWCLRRARPHISFGEISSLQCTHLQPQQPSICVPLIANNETIGVLSIQDNNTSEKQTTRSDTWITKRNQLASGVAEHIALAISNLTLREALRLQAIRDPLTGLYNRRYMQEFLEREIHRCIRRKRSLAIMMLDVDNFKRYNDTFGHPAGDHALRFVGDTLLRSVRADDLACRYGGEEFCLVLPECSLQQAATRAEDIRSLLKRSHMERSADIPGLVTVSIGVAAFGENANSSKILLKFADDALYRAKRAGRDRVALTNTAESVTHAASPP